MDAREVLGMDGNGTMLVGIGAIQKVLTTLKHYKKETERLAFLLQDKADETDHWMEQVNTLQSHCQTLQQQIVELQNMTVNIKCATHFNLDNI